MYTEELNMDLNFPNISVYNRYKDGELWGYKVLPNEGYVMYDLNANDVEIDENTGEEVPVIYYRTILLLTLRYDFNNFSYVAVPRNEVDENYIFGVEDDKEHETM